MNINQYLKKYNMSPIEFAVRCDICLTSLWRYRKGERMHQDTAERIEKKTGGEVTVMELRGKDTRKGKINYVSKYPNEYCRND